MSSRHGPHSVVPVANHGVSDTEELLKRVDFKSSALTTRKETASPRRKILEMMDKFIYLDRDEGFMGACVCSNPSKYVH